jgi:hypothetical protein
MDLFALQEIVIARATPKPIPAFAALLCFDISLAFVKRKESRLPAPALGDGGFTPRQIVGARTPRVYRIGLRSHAPGIPSSKPASETSRLQNPWKADDSGTGYSVPAGASPRLCPRSQLSTENGVGKLGSFTLVDELWFILSIRRYCFKKIHNEKSGEL